MISRRTLLGNCLTAAGTAMVLSSCARALASGQASLVPAPAQLRSVSAAGIAVAPGPWTSLPVPDAGIYLENVLLTMKDGVRLNAFIYLPNHMDFRAPIGAVLNTTPYRNMPQGTEHNVKAGLASVFLDVRGTGGSDGEPLDEYTRQEHLDTAAVIAWMAAQPWCNGNVGMYGVSYSAFNSLQVAYELKPPALKTIVAMAGTDKRYTDDIHYPGGCMLMVDNSWSLGMLVMNTMPGAPEYLLDDQAARDRWETAPWLFNFLRNQRDGEYWDYGSLYTDYSRLEIPTYLVGGYLDIYQNQVMRIMRNSTKAMTMGLLGPWHHWLDTPGPVVDLQGIQNRWFDHWLNGNDTGMLEEPRATFYMPRWRRQSFRFTDPVPGEWRYLDDWPDSAFAPPDTRYLVSASASAPAAPDANAAANLPSGQNGSLSSRPGAGTVQTLEYRPGTGGHDQSFGPTGAEGYYGIDRRDQDVWGLSFDSDVLSEPLEILGFARAKLFVSVSAPIANFIVRICDLAPDGTSYLITRAYLNGTHRNSSRAPEPMQPGTIYELDLEAMCTAYRFEPGHRIRINISNADFPVLWPSPEPFTMQLHTGGAYPSFVALPTLGDVDYCDGNVPMGEPLPDSSEQVDEDTSWYELRKDLERGRTTALFNLPLGGKLTCQVDDNQPGQASMQIDTRRIEEGHGRTIETHSLGSLTSTATDFIVDITITLKEGDRPVRTQRWRETIPRDHV